MEQLNYRVCCATRINSRGLGKPNEDYVLADRDNHIFFLLDGITRVHQEYVDSPGKSAACDVNEIFSREAHRYMVTHMAQEKPDELLRSAAIAGNAALVPYRSQRPLREWQFYPGTLGILALIRENRLYFLYTGDCQGTLIRQGGKLHFGQQEQNGALELMKISKSDRYDLYCNHPSHPLSYGIFNGDADAVPLFQQSSLALEPGDTVILCSDGIRSYIRYAKSEVLRSQSPEEMIEASCRFDVPPFAAYADDKAVIKLEF